MIKSLRSDHRIAPFTRPDRTEDAHTHIVMTITQSQDSKKDVRARAGREPSLEKKPEKMLPKIEPLPGTLIPQFIRCGRPNCKCAKGELHGPYFYRFVRESGRLRKIYVKKADLQAVFDATVTYKQANVALRQQLAQSKREWREAMAVLKEYDRFLKDYCGGRL